MQGRQIGALSAVALLAGLVAAFAFANVYAFPDGPAGLGAGARLLADVVVVLVYAAGGLVLARATGKGPAWWILWLGGPSVLVLLAYATTNGAGAAVLAACSVLGILAGAAAGKAWNATLHAA